MARRLPDHHHRLRLSVGGLESEGPVGRAKLAASGLEELDWIARRILEEDLPATVAGDDVVAESGAGLLQSRDYPSEVFHFDLNPVPPTGLRVSTIRHVASGPSSAPRRAQQETKITSRDEREAGPGMHRDDEAEVLGVEADRGGDVIYDVANTDASHVASSLNESVPPRIAPESDARIGEIDDQLDAYPS